MLCLYPNSSSIVNLTDDQLHQVALWRYQQTMEQSNISPNTTTHQSTIMDAEPGVGLPDLTEAYHPAMSFRKRQSSAMVEQWLTAESPIARATSFSSQNLPHNPYRLPSLSVQTTIPDVPPHQQAQFFYEPNQVVPDTGIPYSGASPPQYSGCLDQSPPHLLHMSDIHHYNMQDQQESMSWVDRPMPPQGAVPAWGLGYDYMHSRYAAPPSSPYSTSSVFYGSPTMSECYSSPEPYPPVPRRRIPRSRPRDECDVEEDEGGSSGKPYAQLIQECLLQAPGHRMMLRDIYDWFERNTTKPRESGGNGWQNSIRHNLSMNKAFENDKTVIANSRGEPKKATSIWFLTDYALRNGVESTTRYRKNTHSRRPVGIDRDCKRVASGSKGGRAARKATHMRRMKAEAWPRQAKIESYDPLNHLVRAANVLDNYPCTRGSSPPSPSEGQPGTPNDCYPSRDYPLDSAMGFECSSHELGFNDLRLQDELAQTGYGQSATDMTWR